MHFDGLGVVMGGGCYSQLNSKKSLLCKIASSCGNRLKKSL